MNFLLLRNLKAICITFLILAKRHSSLPYSLSRNLQELACYMEPTLAPSCGSPVRPNGFCGCGPTSGLMACRSGVFLNQPISLLRCARPR